MTSRWPSWCTEEILWGLNSFPMKKLSFRLGNLHSCRPREWKRSIACNDRKLLIPTWRCMMDRVLMLGRVRQWVYPVVEENKTVIKHKQRTRICFDWLISTRIKSWTNGCLWITAHEGLLQGRKIIAEDRGFKQPLTINAKNYSIVTSLDDFYGTMLANGVDKKIASSVSVRLSRYKVDRKYKEGTKAVWGLTLASRVLSNILKWFIFRYAHSLSMNQLFDRFIAAAALNLIQSLYRALKVVCIFFKEKKKR